LFYVPEIEDNEVTFHHVAFHAVYGVEHLRQVERGEGREGGGGGEGMEGGREGVREGGREGGRKGRTEEGRGKREHV
jgi:hypothetical protein